MGQKHIEISLTGPNMQTKKIKVNTENHVEIMEDHDDVDKVRDKRSNLDRITDLFRHHVGHIDDQSFHEILHQIEDLVQSGQIQPELHRILARWENENHSFGKHHSSEHHGDDDEVEVSEHHDHNHHHHHHERLDDFQNYGNEQHQLLYLHQNQLFKFAGANQVYRVQHLGPLHGGFDQHHHPSTYRTEEDHHHRNLALDDDVALLSPNQLFVPYRSNQVYQVIPVETRNNGDEHQHHLVRLHQSIQSEERQPHRHHNIQEGEEEEEDSPSSTQHSSEQLENILRHYQRYWIHHQTGKFQDEHRNIISQQRHHHQNHHGNQHDDNEHHGKLSHSQNHQLKDLVSDEEAHEHHFHYQHREHEDHHNLEHENHSTERLHERSFPSHSHHDPERNFVSHLGTAEHHTEGHAHHEHHGKLSQSQNHQLNDLVSDEEEHEHHFHHQHREHEDHHHLEHENHSTEHRHEHSFPSHSHHNPERHFVSHLGTEHHTEGHNAHRGHHLDEHQQYFSNELMAGVSRHHQNDHELQELLRHLFGHQILEAYEGNHGGFQYGLRPLPHPVLGYNVDHYPVGPQQGEYLGNDS